MLTNKFFVFGKDFNEDKDSPPIITNAITRGDGVMTDKTDSSQSIYISKDDNI